MKTSLEFGDLYNKALCNGQHVLEQIYHEFTIIEEYKLIILRFETVVSIDISVLECDREN